MLDEVSAADVGAASETETSSLRAVSDLTQESNVPSFDEIKQKVAGQFADAQAMTELSSTSPEVLEMHAHHAEINSEADDILAQLSAGSLKPAALPSPKETV